MAAAAPTDFNDVLTNIGFNAGARAVITGADGEDLDLPALAEFTTDSEVELFVDGLRKPGGTAAANNNDPNRGVRVSAKALDRMKTACYIQRHFARTGRALNAFAFFTVAKLLTWKNYRVAENTRQDPDELPVLLKGTEGAILDFIEEFPQALTSFTGTGGRPLDYVLRPDPTVPAANTQPTFGETGTPFESWVVEGISGRIFMEGPRSQSFKQTKPI